MQTSAWNYTDFIIGLGKVRGRQLSDWLIEQLTDDTENPILSF